MNRRVSLLSLGLVALALPAGFGWAQSAHNSSAPIDFAAAHIELQDKAHQAILSGNVRIRQAEMTLNAARMVVHYTGAVIDGSPQVSRLDASGNVVVTRPNQTARAQYAVYDLNSRVVTMLGNVTLNQGGNTLSGGRLRIDLDTGHASVDGSGVGSSRDSGSDTGIQRSNGQVTGRFSAPDRSK